MRACVFVGEGLSVCVCVWEGGRGGACVLLARIHGVVQHVDVPRSPVQLVYVEVRAMLQGPCVDLLT